MSTALGIPKSVDCLRRGPAPTEPREVRVSEKSPALAAGNEATCRAAFAASFGNVAAVDCAGEVIAVNEAWLRFARQHGARLWKVAAGSNYLKTCETAALAGHRDAAAVLNGIIGVLDGSIRDCGTGIPPDQLGRVFEPFFTTKHKGLGMGLAICRSIVEAHRGEISVANNPDKGVTFRVALPSYCENPV